MSLEDRENQRKTNSVVGAIINSNDVKTSEEDKEALKARSYYLPEKLYKAVNLKAALNGSDKSAVVRLALTEYLKDILEKYEI